MIVPSFKVERPLDRDHLCAVVALVCGAALARARRAAVGGEATSSDTDAGGRRRPGPTRRRRAARTCRTNRMRAPGAPPAARQAAPPAASRSWVLDSVPQHGSGSRRSRTHSWARISSKRSSPVSPRHSPTCASVEPQSGAPPARPLACPAAGSTSIAWRRETAARRAPTARRAPPA